MFQFLGDLNLVEVTSFRGLNSGRISSGFCDRCVPRKIVLPWEKY
jgi:hypothetical protein